MKIRSRQGCSPGAAARVNGGDVREGTGISTVWAVCAGDPVPDDCEPPPY